MKPITLILKEAPPEMAKESGDSKALCYEFKATYSCGHSETCRVWFPFGGVCDTSKLIERYVEVGTKQARAVAKKEICIVCEREEVGE